MGPISIARNAAHAILLAIEAGLGHADDLLRDDPLMATMFDADRHLTTTLVLGVLRWQIQLDQSIRASLTKPYAKLDPAVLIALRLGAFQLLHLDRIPAHAAINESVELTKRSRLGSAASLVNAVLRKIARAAEAEKGQENTRASAADALAAHPVWLIDRWTKFFGADTACAICVHDQFAPASAIRLTSPEVEERLTQAGLTLAPGNLLAAARIVESGDVTASAAFREGRIRIQDEGSQLISELAAAFSKESKEILDCCAAPGGKTLILAERNPTAHIVACEASRLRLKLLRDRLSGLGDRVDCRFADATALSFDADFDAAMADVPCSGTGTLGRNPEIRHRLRPEDLPRHAERQRAILQSALRAVRPGGRVIYSTCSLEPEENEEVIGAVVDEGGKTRVVPLGPALETLRDGGVLVHEGVERLHSCLTPEGFLRIIPGALGTDGFFVAIIEKGV
jgi:16S rRNA (cytosine967-C5)-methyltransferase